MSIGLGRASSLPYDAHAAPPPVSTRHEAKCLFARNKLGGCSRQGVSVHDSIQKWTFTLRSRFLISPLQMWSIRDQPNYLYGVVKMAIIRLSVLQILVGLKSLSLTTLSLLKPGPVTHLTSFTRHRYKAQLDLFPVLHSWYLMRTCLSDYKP